MPITKNPFKPSRPAATTIKPQAQPTQGELLQAYLTESDRARNPDAIEGDRAQATLVANDFNARLAAHEKWKREKAEFEQRRDEAIMARIRARQVAR